MTSLVGIWWVFGGWRRGGGKDKKILQFQKKSVSLQFNIIKTTQ